MSKIPTATPAEPVADASATSRKWSYIFSLVTVGCVVLALYQSVAAARARNEALASRIEADTAKMEVSVLRQQLERERIIAAKQLELLRKSEQSSNASGGVAAPAK